MNAAAHHRISIGTDNHRTDIHVHAGGFRGDGTRKPEERKLSPVQQERALPARRAEKPSHNVTGIVNAIGKGPIDGPGYVDGLKASRLDKEAVVSPAAV